MRTFEELGIFWASPDGHIEVAGITFYGFWSQRQIPDDAGFCLTQVWNGLDAEVAVQPISADDGNYVVVTIWIKRWPSDDNWRIAVERMLHLMVVKGAVVSWCGGEYSSWSLTELDPATSSGCVYAASSEFTGVILHSGLSDEISYLTDDELVQLQAALHTE